MRKKFLLFLLNLMFIISFAQEIDYNIQKGYAAKGYDVVEYFNGSAREGNQHYTITYDSINYKFSSEENLYKFKKDPVNYIPQYGGWCAYAMGTSGKKYVINPKTFEIRDGKLYLFYKAFFFNALNKWKHEGSEKLTLDADEYWNRIISGK